MEECIFVNSRETAPAAAHRDMYKNNSEAAQYGFKSIAIPSELAGSWYVYNKYGSGLVAWKDLVLPSAELARKGVIVSEYLEDAMRETEPYFRKFPSMKSWINPDTGKIYEKGDVIPRPKLADTLEKIAYSADPAEMFYRGEMAGTIVKEITEGGRRAVVGLRKFFVLRNSASHELMQSYDGPYIVKASSMVEIYVDI
ncbi:gamma-glutamyltranspeptidase [Oesophagostomum dentatum]|uniref:Gamma-glutamyltranspeptidase n=1 Tax=Oesophagostomum dentatum TaxID=61180 RepID=A0A0B1TMS5_OESDE|nr:gamma-glutamyltranspeptidase [Oesophagostomum dentatum]